MQVYVQGVDAEVRVATGDYDQVGLGSPDPETLRALLERLQAVRERSSGPGDDLCPPSMMVERGDLVVTFTSGAGALYCAEVESDVTVAEACALVGGKLGIEERRQSSRAETQADRLATRSAPAQRADVLPTDLRGTSEETIDTRKEKQVCLRVSKSHDASQLPAVVTFLGAVFLVVGLLAFTADDPGAGSVGVGCLVVGAALLLSRGTVRRWSLAKLRLGFDWNTNTFWLARAGEPLSWIPDANMIAAFVGVEEGRPDLKTRLKDAAKTIAAAAVLGDGEADEYEIEWFLVAETVNGKRATVTALACKQDLARVVEAANRLLQAQPS